MQNAGGDQGNRNTINLCYRQPYVRLQEGRCAEGSRITRYSESINRMQLAPLRETPGRNFCRELEETEVDGINELGANSSPT